MENLIIFYIFALIIVFTILGIKMKNTKKYFISLSVTTAVVVLGIVAGVLPTNIGKCGDKAWFTYNIYKTARVYGNGSISFIKFDENGVEKKKIVPVEVKKVILKNGITEINKKAFYGYENLEKVEIPNSVTNIENHAFYRTGLKEINISQNVKSIGEYAFAYTNLKEINIPDNINNIEQGVFEGCANLENVILPNTITVINASTFSKCTKLSNIKLDNIKKVSDYAFSETGLQEINLPDEIELTSGRAFYRCEKLEKIKVSDNNANYFVKDDVLYAKRNYNTGEKIELVLYPAGKQNTSYLVDESVDTICSGAMTANPYLKQLDIEAKVIEQNAIYGENIETINITDSFELIYKYAIYGCENLKKLTINGKTYENDDITYMLEHSWKNNNIKVDA
mgnify:CR=1 FL=1